MNSTWMFLAGSVAAFLGVGAGAFGAHTLKNSLTTEMLQVFETAVRYQMYHAFALLAAAFAVVQWPEVSRQFGFAAWLFVIGIVLFSGSLYVLSTTGTKWWGAITPIGGIAFLGGWIMLVIGILSRK